MLRAIRDNWLIGIFLVVGLACMSFGVELNLDARDFLAHAAHAKGVVTFGGVFTLVFVVVVLLDML